MKNTNPQPPLLTQRNILICLGLIALAAAVRLPGVDLLYFNVHAARDLYRTFMLVHEGQFQFFGPELNYGGRTLGPAVYFLLVPPMLVSPSPVATYLYLVMLSCLAVAGLYLLVHRYLGWKTAAIAGLAAALNPQLVIALRYMWNPTFIFPIAVAMMAAAMWARGRPTSFIRWGVLGLIIGVGIQVHFSLFMIGVAAVIVALWDQWRSALWGIPSMTAVIGLLCVPALIGLMAAPETYGGTWETIEVTRSGFDVIGFNYNAFLVLGELISPDPGETFWRGSFTHFEYMRDHAAGSWALLAFSAKVELLTTTLARIVTIIGFALCIAWTLKRRGDERLAKETRAFYLLTLLWIAIPLVMLMWYNPLSWLENKFPEITEENNPPSYIADRYFYQCWPAICVVFGIGTEWLLLRRQRWIAGLASLAVVWVFVFHTLFIATWISVADRQGRGFYHTGINDRPIPMYRTVRGLVEELRGQRLIGRADIDPARINTGWELGFYNREVEFDYVMRLVFRQTPKQVHGELRQGENLLIQYVEDFPEEASARFSTQIEGYRVYIVSENDEAVNKLRRDNWFAPYYPREGKRGLLELVPEE